MPRNLGGAAILNKQLETGRAIANALPKAMELKEAARILGMTPEMVRYTECIALAKIASALKRKGYTRTDAIALTDHESHILNP